MLDKRIITLGLSLLIAVTLAACGSRNEATPTPAPTTAPAAVEATATEAPSASEAATETVTSEAATTETVTSEAATTETVTSEPATSEPATSEEVTTTEVASTTTAAGAPLITISSDTWVGDIINDKNPSLVTLSADGSMLVWPQVTGRLWNKKEGLCTYTFTSAAKSCADAPPTFEGYPYAFFSSPDSSAFAFTEDPIQLGYESDIWTFDVASGAFNDLTNDNVEGSYLSAPANTYTLDYLPMWSPTGDNIYFWRSVPIQAPITYTLQLMRIAPTGGTPEMVSDLTQALAGNLLFFSNQYWFMDGVSAISPDGSKIAMIMSDIENPEGDVANGVWIVDLNNPTAAPTQIATQAALESGQPAWSTETFPLVPLGLSWTADSSSIVVMTYNQDQQVPLVVLYNINTASGEMTPVVDFSQVPEGDAYVSAPVTVNGVEGPPMRFFSPWTASMSPNNEQVLMYQNLGGFSGLLVSALPPTSSLPAIAYTSQNQNSGGVFRSSRGTDGKVLISNILFSTSQTK